MIHDMRSKFPVVMSLAFLVIVVYVLDGLELPEQSRLWRELTNAGHAPLFGVLSLAMLILVRRFIQLQSRSWLGYVIAGGIATFVGLATEFIQYFTPRDASILDMIYNLVGIVSFLTFAGTFDPRMQTLGIVSNRLKRNLARMLAVSLFCTTLISFTTIALAHVHRGSQFPVILDFECWLDHSFILTDHGEIEFVKLPFGWRSNTSESVGEWEIQPRGMSMIAVQYPVPDWSGYDTLALDIYSPTADTTRLYLRVNDVEHNFEYTDRFNTELTILPGVNTVRIPLAQVENAPTTRKLDMHGIANIIIFAAKRDSSAKFYLDDIRLK